MPPESVLELMEGTLRIPAPRVERARALLRGQPGFSDLKAAALLLDQGVVSRAEADQILHAVASTHRPDLPPRDLTGRVLGKYRLLRRLDQGAFESSYAAEHAESAIPAALRVFHRPGLEARLRAETLRLARIDHPNLPRFLHFGVDEQICFVATSCVEGVSLADMALLPDPTFSQRALPWLRQMSGALDALHRAGLVHGSIEPAHVIVGDDGLAHLVGLPLSAGRPEDLLILPVAEMPTFAPPERLAGDPADAPGDLYSLAATFYWLIGGEACLGAPTYAGLLMRRSLEKAAPDPLLRTGVDPAVAAALLRSLAPAGERFPDAAALLAALPETAPPIPAAAVKSPSPEPVALRVVRKTPALPAAPRGRDPMKTLILAASGVLIVLLGILTAVVLRRRPPPAETARPAPEARTPVPDPVPRPPDRAQERQRLIAAATRAREQGDIPQAARLLREAEAIEKSADLARLLRATENQLREHAREKAEYERLDRTLAALPDEAALQACEDFLRQSTTSSYAEKVLFRKMEYAKRLEAAKSAERPPADQTPAPSPPPVSPAKPPEVAARTGVPGRALPVPVKEAILWLARHQNGDGSWSVAKHFERCRDDRCSPSPGSSEYDTGVTALAVLAILGTGIGWNDQDEVEGIHLGESLRRGIDAILASREPDGAIGSRKRSKHLYQHALGTHALAEAVRSCAAAGADVPFEKSRALRDALSNAADYLVQARNPSRGWRYGVRDADSDSSVTAVALAALEAARRAGAPVPAEALQGGLAWFQETQDGGGRVGYTHRGTGKVYVPGMNEHFEHHETLTAAALTCRLLLAREKSDSTRPAMLQIVVKDPPGREGNTLDYYHLYWGTRALKEYGEARSWDSWKEPLVRLLSARQSREPGRCRRGSWEPVDRWSGEGGRVYATALNALTLECALQPRLFDFARPAAAEPAVEPVWLFKLKNGGQLRVLSYEEREGGYWLRIATGKTVVAKEDVVQIQKIGAKEKP